jgi:hypothetical protein
MSGAKQTWAEVLAGYAKTAVNEALLPAAEKLAAHGASELASALYTGQAFVMYGPANAPISQGMEADGGVQGSESAQATQQQPMGLDQAAETQAQTTYESGHEASLALYAARAQQSQHTQEYDR